MFHQFLQANFGVTGGLWSNIMASVLLAGVGFFWGRTFEKRQQKRHTETMLHIKKIHRHLGIEEE